MILTACWFESALVHALLKLYQLRCCRCACHVRHLRWCGSTMELCLRLPAALRAFPSCKAMILNNCGYTKLLHNIFERRACGLGRSCR